MPLPSTLGELRRAGYARRPVKDEVRDNLITALRDGTTLFPGIVGYDDTVVPQIVNAILSRHNFILLGLRGQAKSRILRALTSLLDAEVPVMPGCEIHDDPLAPICAACRARLASEGDATPIAWLPRDARYVEKLATPDVTIADMIGDIDPIKAARAGLDMSNELTMHYGLLPRANRGIFAINELPDLAGRIQVGLFNILQEGDVQIKGFPVRLPLDLMMVFSANPEDYTARGKIITPLKDRIGSEVRTHYPRSRAEGVAITAQEAWTRRGAMPVDVPPYVREIVEEIAFQARADQKVDRRSGVSQRLPITVLENAVSNAERRAVIAGETVVVPRVTDIYSALPSLTGKIELEYEGELRGAEHVARELVRGAVATVFDSLFATVDTRTVVEWFDMGGELDLGDMAAASDVVEKAQDVQGLVEAAQAYTGEAPHQAAAIDFVLEGLCSLKRISRAEGGAFGAAEPARRRAAERVMEAFGDQEEEEIPQGRKKYYN
ncbi:MAG: magnesium chelatase [Acidobacteriota bacterium]|nr:magnesium chelatase [Acidobacteriota bacterium]